jgi:hypothetical protein
LLCCSSTLAAPAREAVETLLRTAAEAEQKISKLAFAQKAVSSRAALQESFDHLRGAVMIAYPMGLPEARLCQMGGHSSALHNSESFHNQFKSVETTIKHAGRVSETL